MGSRILFLAVWLAAVLVCLPANHVLVEAAQETSITLDTPSMVLAGIPFDLKVHLSPYMHNNRWPDKLPYAVINHEEKADRQMETGVLHTKDKKGNIVLDFDIENLHFAESGNKNFSVRFNVNDTDISIYDSTYCMTGWLSVLPPFVTIAIAVWLKQVFIALILGIYMGSFFFNGFNAYLGFLRTADTYLVKSFAVYDHAAVLSFSFLLGGMIGIVQKSGGGLGLAGLVTQFASTPKRVCLACFCLGLCIFFDDFTSVLIVGNSMRGVALSLKVSAEKFAFIIHTMAVCMASLSPISSWIGVEIGYISSAFVKSGVQTDAFWMFLTSIPYRFFPLLMVYFVLLNILSEKEYGPMKKAEADARLETTAPSHAMTGDNALEEDADLSEMGLLAPAPGCPRRWYNGAIPFLTLVICTVISMGVSGRDAILALPAEEQVPITMFSMFTHANSIKALMWSTLFSCLVSVILVCSQGLLTIPQSIEAWVVGAKDILEPVIILILAWGLGDVVNDLKTGVYLAHSIGSNLPVGLLPFMVSSLAFLMSYATGSAFGSMGIIFPLVIPIVCKLTPDASVHLHVVACILGGCAFGNVVSPIGDTTILTAIAAHCELNAHVSTMSLYVLTVAFTGLIFGDLFVGLGLYNHYVGMGVCVCLLTAFQMFVGKKPIHELKSLLDSSRDRRGYSHIPTSQTGEEN
eukprot:Nk52_evm45s208 gene=Nk52_evmTU45s208